MRNATRTKIFYYLLTLIVLGFVVAWFFFKVEKKPLIESRSWTVTYKHLGTLSSPRLADLNDDGTLDVIIGGGNVEFRASDSAIIAIDGSDGRILWTAPARDQIFGSPVFQDITSDGVPDVFIGGRAAELKAINGKNGKVIWEYYSGQVNISESDSGAYNFYSPQFIPDQDDDGLKDLIVAAGGYVKALPHDPKRPAGKLVVISSASGTRLASADMPDGKEIYMSVVLADFKGDGHLSVIFGTGGETLGGGLYKALLTDLLKNSLSDSKLLDTGHEKGFIAPPVLADITGDGIYDIVANAVNGRMIAIDGATDQILWTVSIPGTEAYCSIAPGYYTGDDVPDFFTNYGIGIWPDLHRSIQFMVNGKTGQIEFRDSLGTFQESTPVTFDYNQDGYDDGLYSLNFQHTSGFSNQLMVIDFHNDTIYETGPRHYGANVATTPWIGDIEQDGYLDIVYCNEINPFDLLSVTFKEGLKISKIKTAIPIKESLSWGAYMGSYYDGVFRGRKKNTTN
ncbi:MAG: PQQ-binding-like beta-propeller repeat protein [Cyclobacteriaceae bacterium]